MSEKRVEKFSIWLQTHGVSQRGSGKMTPGGLAQAAQISRAAAYAYFTGSRVPDDPEVISRIAKALRVAPQDVPVFSPKTTK